MRRGVDGSTPKPGLFWGALPKSPAHLRSQNQALVQGPPSTHPRRQIWRASLGPGIDFVAEKPSFCQNQRPPPVSKRATLQWTWSQNEDRAAPPYRAPSPKPEPREGPPSGPRPKTEGLLKTRGRRRAPLKTTPPPGPLLSPSCSWRAGQAPPPTRGSRSKFLAFKGW